MLVHSGAAAGQIVLALHPLPETELERKNLPWAHYFCSLMAIGLVELGPKLNISQSQQYADDAFLQLGHPTHIYAIPWYNRFTRHLAIPLMSWFIPVEDSVWTFPNTHTSIWAPPKEAIISFLQQNAQDCSSSSSSAMHRWERQEASSTFAFVKDTFSCQGHFWVLTLSFVMRHCMRLVFRIYSYVSLSIFLVFLIGKRRFWDNPFQDMWHPLQHKMLT